MRTQQSKVGVCIEQSLSGLRITGGGGGGGVERHSERKGQLAAITSKLERLHPHKCESYNNMYMYICLLLSLALKTVVSMFKTARAKCGTLLKTDSYYSWLTKVGWTPKPLQP
jgi:hypothetical protein